MWCGLSRPAMRFRISPLFRRDASRMVDSYTARARFLHPPFIFGPPVFSVFSFPSFSRCRRERRESRDLLHRRRRRCMGSSQDDLGRSSRAEAPQAGCSTAPRLSLAGFPFPVLVPNETVRPDAPACPLRPHLSRSPTREAGVSVSRGGRHCHDLCRTCSTKWLPSTPYFSLFFLTRSTTQTQTRHDTTRRVTFHDM